MDLKKTFKWLAVALLGSLVMMPWVMESQERGSDPTAVKKANNLSDLTNSILARSNLAVGSYFLPSKIPSLALWLSADQLTNVLADGAAVTTWADQSGRGNHAVQTNASQKPTFQAGGMYGRPTVRIGTSTKQLVVSTFFTRNNIDTNLTLFLVAKKGTTNNSYGFILGDTAGTWWYARTAGGHNTKIGGANSTLINAINPIRPYVEAYRWNGLYIQYSHNGYKRTDYSTAFPGTLNAAGDLYIGNTGINDGVWDGDVSDVLIYTNVLSDIEVNLVENWLKTKNGLDSSYIVMTGDSIANGFGAAAGLTPLQFILHTPAISNNWDGVLMAQNGNFLAQSITNEIKLIDIPNPGGRNRVCVIWEGTNDLLFGGTYQNIYSNLVDVAQSRRRAGYKVVVVTMLPRSPSGTPAGFDVARTNFNNQIRLNWKTFSDGLADVAWCPTFYPTNCVADLALFTDKTHLTEEGNRIASPYIATAIDSIYAAKPISATKTANYTILNGESGTLFDNFGASGEVDFTLHMGYKDLTFTFTVATGQILKIIAASTDTIQNAGTLTAAGGNISSSTVGDSVTLRCVSPGKYVVISKIGTW